MNELIGTAFLFAVVMILGGIIYVCDKFIPIIVEQIRGFIRWRRTIKGKTKDVYYRWNKD